MIFDFGIFDLRFGGRFILENALRILKNKFF